MCCEVHKKEMMNEGPQSELMANCPSLSILSAFKVNATLINQYGYTVLKNSGYVNATSLYFCCLIYCNTNFHHL
jgi:hypothetical protein